MNDIIMTHFDVIKHTGEVCVHYAGKPKAKIFNIINIYDFGIKALVQFKNLTCVGSAIGCSSGNQYNKLVSPCFDSAEFSTGRKEYVSEKLVKEPARFGLIRICDGGSLPKSLTKN